VKNPQTVASAQYSKTIQDAKIRGVSVWFYIIAGLQLLSAFLAWQNGNQGVAAAGATFAVADILIGAAFVVLGYFAGQKHAWAFVAGLVLYAVRIVVDFFQFFSVISLVIRLYLAFRIWQGLQACLAVNRAERAMTILGQRRLVMPTASPASATVEEPAPAAQPWRQSMQQTEPETP
jgi:uncharacterized membrane protein